ncbi:hypothetical protein HHI36_020413 [Cryptolaemus montrouzieri]|uniref:Neuropeptide-like 4 n=1 Tax=Cryptolaemus montrouzieri TaxID=559131 RepID=A0ABD2NB74_9CUCU
MFAKISLVVFAILAIAFAAPKPALVAAPVAYTAPIAAVPAIPAVGYSAYSAPVYSGVYNGVYGYGQPVATYY